MIEYAKMKYYGKNLYIVNDYIENKKCFLYTITYIISFLYFKIQIICTMLAKYA